MEREEATAGEGREEAETKSRKEAAKECKKETAEGVGSDRFHASGQQSSDPRRSFGA
jgi:hypothetical protein